MEQRKLTTQPHPDQPEEQGRKRARRRRSQAKATRNRTSLPLWAKGLISLGLLFVSLLAGLVVGYSVVGNGSWADALDFQTYKHMYDLVFKTAE